MSKTRSGFRFLFFVFGTWWQTTTQTLNRLYPTGYWGSAFGLPLPLPHPVDGTHKKASQDATIFLFFSVFSFQFVLVFSIVHFSSSWRQMGWFWRPHKNLETLEQTLWARVLTHSSSVAPWGADSLKTYKVHCLYDGLASNVWHMVPHRFSTNDEVYQSWWMAAETFSIGYRDWVWCLNCRFECLVFSFRPFSRIELCALTSMVARDSLNGFDSGQHKYGWWLIIPIGLWFVEVFIWDFANTILDERAT